MLTFALMLVTLFGITSPDDALMRAAARHYPEWGRVDERPAVAPTRCAAQASLGKASTPRLSDAGPHKKKLYYLWASDRAAYLALSAPDASVPVGFTIVKEAFVALPFDGKARHEGHGVGAPEPRDWLALADGTKLQTGKHSALFVMTKVGPREGTDAGWLYGTVAPSGKVTSVGRIDSCMGCHESAPHDRLFGLREDVRGP